jgi:hypothetical protein
MIRDACKWEVDLERIISKFDVAYYRGLLETLKRGPRTNYLILRSRMRRNYV